MERGMSGSGWTKQVGSHISDVPQRDLLPATPWEVLGNVERCQSAYDVRHPGVSFIPTDGGYGTRWTVGARMAVCLLV